MDNQPIYHADAEDLLAVVNAVQHLVSDADGYLEAGDVAAARALLAMPGLHDAGHPEVDADRPILECHLCADPDVQRMQAKMQRFFAAAGPKA